MKKLALISLVLLAGCGDQPPADLTEGGDNLPVVEIGRVVSKDENDNLGSGEVKLLNTICAALQAHERFAQAHLIDKNVVLNYKTQKKECGDPAPYTQEVGLKLVSMGGNARFERVRGGNQFFADFESADRGQFDVLCDAQGLVDGGGVRRHRSSGSTTVWARLYERNTHYCPKTDDTHCAVFITGSEQEDGNYLVRQIDALTISTKKDDSRGMVLIRGRESKILCDRDKILMTSQFLNAN